MRSSILPILSLISGTGIAQAASSDFYHGVNVRLYGHGGVGWKSASDWNQTFSGIKHLAFPFNAVRVYASQEEGGQYKPLPLIFDAIHDHDLHILLGLYLEDGTGKTDAQIFDQSRFALEFQALRDGLQYAESIGVLDKVIGISVGNEDFFQKWLDQARVAEMIKRVQQWLRAEFTERCIPVGHTDTYEKLLRAENKDLTDTADFLAANAFPYWENVSIDDAAEHFKATTTMLDTLSQERGIPIMLGETGWPTDGQYMTRAIASIENLQRYWKEVVCSKEFLERDAFFYIDEDVGAVPSGPHWGILDQFGNPRIDLSCPEMT